MRSVEHAARELSGGAILVRAHCLAAAGQLGVAGRCQVQHGTLQGGAAPQGHLCAQAHGAACCAASERARRCHPAQAHCLRALPQPRAKAGGRRELPPHAARLQAHAPKEQRAGLRQRGAGAREHGAAGAGLHHPARRRCAVSAGGSEAHLQVSGLPGNAARVWGVGRDLEAEHWGGRVGVGREGARGQPVGGEVDWQQGCAKGLPQEAKQQA
jgi:hypothetical protein